MLSDFAYAPRTFQARKPQLIEKPDSKNERESRESRESTE